MPGQLGIFARYARGLRGFLRHPVTAEQCRERLESGLAKRERSFVRVLERGVFARPQSPYRRLMAHAGIEFGDVQGLVHDEGVEGALGQLHDAGVYVTLEEFKGRRTVERGSLVLPVKVEDFDNPLLTKHYEARSGGSRGARRHVSVDLEAIAHETAHHWAFLEAFGLQDRPLGIWYPVPPAPGLKLVLHQVKLGKPVQRWFSHTDLAARPFDLKSLAVTGCALAESRIWGRTIPLPEHAPPDEAGALRVAAWLASARRKGAPALLITNASSAVRVARAAMSHGLNVAGSFFRLGGEPYTAAKAHVVEQAGVQAVCNYAMSEAGLLGIACASPHALDDVHLFTEKATVIQRIRQVAGGEVAGLLHTTLLPSCPKLMLNVESGDYGLLTERRCGCAIGKLGFSMHLSGIRSHEKLTSAGTSFLGSDLMTLVEDVLPKRFGGNPIDYQLVEQENDGLPMVSVVVSPGVGQVDHEQVVATVLEVLQANPQARVMADMWRKARTLRVTRREPYATPANKILPLHLLQRSDRSGSGART